MNDSATSPAVEAEAAEKQPSGVSLTMLRTVDVSMEMPGVVDPVTGEAAVFTFECDRPNHGISVSMAAIRTQEDISPRESVLAIIGLVTADLRGVLGFRPRARDASGEFTESREAFRARLVPFLREAGEDADSLLAGALNLYSDVSEPRRSFRHFPR